MGYRIQSITILKINNGYSDYLFSFYDNFFFTLLKDFFFKKNFFIENISKNSHNLQKKILKNLNFT